MAAAGDGDIGEAEAARATKNRRTIYDYLGEGEDSEEASPPSPETPPRLRLPRFTCARIRFGRLGRKRGGSRGRKEAAAAEKSEGASSVDTSSGSLKQAAGTTTGSVAAAQTGMGLSMLLLLARTCVELNRMAEVRAQMEALLKEIRDEASRVKGAAADHAAVVTPETRNNLQLSSTTTASSSCVSDTSTNCLEIGRGEDGKRASEDDGCARMDDALEAEFGIAEPAQRRVPQPECECSNEQETPECSMQSSDDEFIELEGGRFGGGGGGDSDDCDDDDGSRSSSSRERNQGGVSPIELERRLHELRHRRDRERIGALESALRRAERRLTEKEMEARLWQDTAALALGQPTTPRDDGRQ
ncbi:hypothetical protein BAE44_0016495 [Dichanthelium oligosanthes]|uniref:Protein POLAR LOCALIZATION DURING ASYMMETRIC DIVISION AND REDISTRIBUTION n=1 Tax=Dichanthelium oligosanthes TaxID=888268 RepID=A0A1E5VBS9_9POAL|nr:hypothetical protein BAE44_0016495 [Dichanthelium oligosanthes]